MAPGGECQERVNTYHRSLLNLEQTSDTFTAWLAEILMHRWAALHSGTLSVTGCIDPSTPHTTAALPACTQTRIKDARTRTKAARLLMNPGNLDS